MTTKAQREWYLKNKDDPEFKRRGREASRRYYQRRKDDPAFRERRRERNRAYIKQRRETDPDFREREKQYKKEWELRNKDNRHESKRSYNRKYGIATRLARRLSKMGCCMVCWTINPFILEDHHIFGNGQGLEVHLCANHHEFIHRLGWNAIPSITEARVSLIDGESLFLSY